MRILPVLLSSILVSAALASDTNLILFTNLTTSFTNLQGRAYENVKLTKADLDGLIWTTESGGGGRVSFTNLSPALLTSLGVPTNRIAMAHERIRQGALNNARRQSAQQAAAAQSAAVEARLSRVTLAYSLTRSGYRKFLCVAKNSTAEEVKVRVEFHFYNGDVSISNPSQTATVAAFGKSLITQTYWDEADHYTIAATYNDRVRPHQLRCSRVAPLTPTTYGNTRYIHLPPLPLGRDSGCKNSRPDEEAAQVR